MSHNAVNLRATDAMVGCAGVDIGLLRIKNVQWSGVTGEVVRLEATGANTWRQAGQVADYELENHDGTTIFHSRGGKTR